MIIPIVILIAALLLVFGGMAISGGLSAGPIAQGKYEVLLAQANQIDAATRQRVLDQMTVREHWSLWLNTLDPWAQFFMVAAAIVMFLCAARLLWAFARAFSVAVTAKAYAYGMKTTMSSLMDPFRPRIDQKGDIFTVWLPALFSRVLVYNARQAGFVTDMSKDGVKTTAPYLHAPAQGSSLEWANAHRDNSLVAKESHHTRWNFLNTVFRIVGFGERYAVDKTPVEVMEPGQNWPSE